VRLGEWHGLSLSPDGRFVLAFPGGQYTSDHLVLVPTGAGDTREIRHASIQQFATATWFPDGKRIAVVSDNEERSRRRLFAWDVDMSAPPRPLSPEAEVDAHPVVSPNGRLVVVAIAGAGPVLFPVDGGTAQPVRGSAAADQPLGWSTDGRGLFVSRRRLIAPSFAQAFIDRIEIATGERRLWRELAPVDPAGVSGIFSVRVAPDAQSYAYAYASSISSLFLAEGLK